MGAGCGGCKVGGEEWERIETLNLQQGVSLELRAKVFCDFSLWYLKDHLPKICESGHSKTELLLYKHLQQGRCFTFQK